MRKYQWLIIFTLIGGMAFFASCDRAQDMLDPVISDPKPPEVIEDDALDTTALQNSLTIEGATAVGRQLPVTSTAETAPTIQADVGEINASPGGTVSLPFAYSGTNALSGCIVCIEGVDGYFDLPYGGAPDALPSAISVSLPENVALGSFTVCYSVYDDQGQYGNFINVVINVTEPMSEVPEPEPMLNQYIYWTVHHPGKIQRANLDGSNVQDLVTGLVWADQIAVDFIGGKMYWVDQGGLERGVSKIQRANLDGTNVEDLVITNESHPVSIALDVAGDKMYWTTRRVSKIQRANLDGTNVEDLITIGLDSPGGIELDIVDGKMYWVNFNYDVSKIQRANLDGTNVEDLVTTGLHRPSDIALDVANGKMYWTEHGSDSNSRSPEHDTAKIRRANLDGSDIQDLVNARAGRPEDIALDLGSSKMYWTDWIASKIRRANLDGSVVEEVISGSGDILGIALSP